MSYLILTIAFLYGMCSVGIFFTQMVNGCFSMYHKQSTKFNLKDAVRQGGIAFALTCLAIYINHWPKR